MSMKKKSNVAYLQSDLGKGSEGFEYLATEKDFQSLLSQHFRRAAMSYGQLAAAVQRDVAYVHRLVNGEQSRPSPNTVIRLALALKLSVIETDELLLAAGYAPLVFPGKVLENQDTPIESS